MQFWLLTLITQFRKTISKDGVLLAVHTSGASAQSSASHLLTFLVAQLQFLREWKLSDRRLYEVLERRLWFEVTPKKEITGRLKNHAFFLRHPVLSVTNFVHDVTIAFCVYSIKRSVVPAGTTLGHTIHQYRNNSGHCRNINRATGVT